MISYINDIIAEKHAIVTRCNWLPPLPRTAQCWILDPSTTLTHALPRDNKAACSYMKLIRVVHEPYLHTFKPTLRTTHLFNVLHWTRQLITTFHEDSVEEFSVKGRMQIVGWLWANLFLINSAHLSVIVSCCNEAGDTQNAMIIRN